MFLWCIWSEQGLVVDSQSQVLQHQRKFAYAPMPNSLLEPPLLWQHTCSLLPNSILKWWRLSPTPHLDNITDLLADLLPHAEWNPNLRPIDQNSSLLPSLNNLTPFFTLSTMKVLTAMKTVSSSAVHMNFSPFFSRCQNSSITSHFLRENATCSTILKKLLAHFWSMGLGNLLIAPSNLAWLSLLWQWTNVLYTPASKLKFASWKGDTVMVANRQVPQRVLRLTIVPTRREIELCVHF